MCLRFLQGSSYWIKGDRDYWCFGLKFVENFYIVLGKKMCLKNLSDRIDPTKNFENGG